MTDTHGILLDGDIYHSYVLSRWLEKSLSFQRGACKVCIGKGVTAQQLKSYQNESQFHLLGFSMKTIEWLFPYDLIIGKPLLKAFECCYKDVDSNTFVQYSGEVVGDSLHEDLNHRMQPEIHPAGAKCEVGCISVDASRHC